MINALEPRFNVDVMQARLMARSDYMDLAQGGPRYLTGTLDCFEFLGWRQRFAADRIGELTVGGKVPTGCYPWESFDPEPIGENLTSHNIVMEVADLTDSLA